MDKKFAKRPQITFGLFFFVLKLHDCSSNCITKACLFRDGAFVFLKKLETVPCVLFIFVNKKILSASTIASNSNFKERV